MFGLAILFFACNSKKETRQKEKNETEMLPKTIDEVVENAEDNVGKVVFVQGLVYHTCEHSGRRCFLVNADESLSIRVEVGGEIKHFEKELVGATIKLKGTLEEKRLTGKYIDEFEEKIKASKDSEEGREHYNAQMNNIKKMRKWMEDHQKEYYPIYFIAGESYEVVE